MVNYLDQSQHPSPPARRCDRGAIAGMCCLGVAAAMASLLTVIGFLFSAPVVHADQWLDRVERSLRRIESAAKYAEPAGAGSKLATKTHNACIHESDKDACAKLIWRSPELLPVRDWAVGTAHIKRGEMREQTGDETGALEDYRDALGYHQFSNLKARIKRLEKRISRREQSAAEKKAAEAKTPPARPHVNGSQVKSALGTKKSQQAQKSAPKAGAAVDSTELRHPIVVVAGWAATLGDKDVQPGAGIANSSSQKASVSEPAPPPSKKADGRAAASTTKTAPSEKQIQKSERVATVLARPAPAAVSSQVPVPAPVKVQRTRPPGLSGLAGRFVPGRDRVTKTLTAGDARTSVRAAGLLRSPKSQQDTEPHKENPPSAALASQNTLQFNVNDDVARSLARIRSKTNEVLTTSALPDRSRMADTARQRSFQSLTFMALLTLMLCSTFAVAMGWRPALPNLLPRAERKPVLSVDDLERLIKSRTGELGNDRTSAKAADGLRHPKIGPVARAPLPQDFSDAAVSDIPPLPLTQPGVSTPAQSQKTETAEDGEFKASEGARAPVVNPPAMRTPDKSPSDTRSVETKTSGRQILAEAAATDNPLELLDTSLLRRVSYGAAGVVVVTSAKTTTDDLLAKVDVARRSDLLKRVVTWDAMHESAKGVLNPFAFGGSKPVDDALAVRQRFNAAFEFYNTIFESIFGARFVYDQKSTLRYLVMLLQAMPDSSLLKLYQLLEAPRTLEPLHDALLNIESVPARLFFTTVFSSEEFAEKAEFMRAQLAPVVANELVGHLCCGRPTTDPMTDLTKTGGVVLLALQPDLLEPVQQNVIVRSLLSVLALHRGARPASQDGEISSSVLLPNAKQKIGGSPTDAEFLLSQVTRAGYTVF